MDEAVHPSRSALRLGAIPGASPDKWVARWRERYPDFTLRTDYFDEAGQVARVREGTVDVGYFRVLHGGGIADHIPSGAGQTGGPGQGLGPDAADDLHRVVLYREDAAVCAAEDHWIAAADQSVAWEEIAGEAFFTPEQMLQQVGSGVGPVDVHTPVAGKDLARGERLALETAASGAGLVVLPFSMARMLMRRDMVVRTLTGHPGYETGLIWLREQDDPVIQEFIGVARGRRPGSGRNALPQKRQKASQGSTRESGKAKGEKSPAQGTSATRGAGGATAGRPRSRQKPGSRRGQPPRGRRRR